MIYLITGGSGSGKSAYAETLARRLAGGGERALYYIATMNPYGSLSKVSFHEHVQAARADCTCPVCETKRKIERHRKMRAGRGFLTIECYTGLKHVKIPVLSGTYRVKESDSPVVLLECMSNLVANERYMEGGAGYRTVEEVMDGVRHLDQLCSHVVIVTNEVNSESGRYDEEIKAYQQIMGTINCKIGNIARETVEVVYGIPVFINSGKAPSDYDRTVPELNHVTRDRRKSMYMIIGGAHQGKFSYAKRIFPNLKWEDGKVCHYDALYFASGIFDFQEYVYRMMKEGKDMDELATKLAGRNPDIVIVTNEIGYGLVPVDPFERMYRECTGRICTELAALSGRVDRVVCGFGMTIKGGNRNDDED